MIKSWHRRLLRVSLLALVLLVPLLVACAAPAPASPTAAPPKPAAAPTGAAAAPAPAAAPTAAPAAAPAKPKGTLKIYELPALTGAFAGTVAPAWKGAEAYRRYVNEHGGLEGYDVEYVWADSGYQTARTLSLYKRFKEEKAPLVYLWSTADGEALKATLAEDKIVGYNNGASWIQINPPGWIFGNNVPYEDAFAAWLEWTAKTWKGPDKPKVGVIVYEVGWGLLHIDEAKQLGPRAGVEFGDSEVVNAAIVDTTAILTRFQQKGVNTIYTTVGAGPFGVLTRDLAKLGLSDKIKLTAFWWADIETNVRLAKEAAEGTRNLSYWPAATDPGPNVKKVVEYWDSLYAEPATMASLQGWAAHELLFEAYRNALKKVGSPDKITGPVIKEGFESIKDWEGMLHPKVTITADSRISVQKLRMVEVQKGLATAISDWFPVRFLPRTPDNKIDYAKYEPPK